MPSSNRTSTPIGSSTIWGRTGFTRFMNCRSPAASRTISGKLLTRSKTARSASCSRSFPARDRAAGEQPPGVGDHPNLPRDPDKFDGDVDTQREFRERGVPSGLANEIYLDVYERLASFEPQVRNLQQRLFDAYAAEVKRVSANDEGIITAAQATSTPRRTASRTMNGYSCRRRCSTASR